MSRTETAADGPPPRTAAQAGRLVRIETWIASHPLWLCGLLYLLALGLRLLYLSDFQNSLVARVPLMDEAYYKAEAWSIARGAPPAADAFFMTPLYPYFLSLVFRLVGDGPVAPFAVQLALGAFAAPLSFLVARAAVRPILALFCGIAVASFAHCVFFEALFLVEGLVLLALLAACACVLGPPRLLLAAAAGVALGVAVLGRGSNLLLALPLGLGCAVAARAARRSWRRHLAAFALALLAVLSPLLVTNAVRTGRPLLLTANAGFNLYIGNGPEATGIFVRIPGLDLQQDPLTLRYVQRRLRRVVTASETSDYWMERTREHVSAHPGRTLELFGWKLLLFWNRMSIPQVEGFEAVARDTVLSRPPFWHRFDFLPVGLVGAWLALWPVVRRLRPGSARDGAAATARAKASFDVPTRARALLGATALLYGISIALFFVTDRYRLPVLPLVIVLAATVVETILGSFAPERRRRLLPLGAALVLAFAGTAPRLLGVDERRMWRDLHVHTALRYAAAERYEDALGEYRAALQLDPGDADTRDGYARMLGRAGRDSLALNQFRALLRDDPRDARAWYNFGNLLRRLGRREAALGAYRRALEIEPARETAWNHVGEVYRALGDTARAAAAYQQALAIVPGHEQALNNLAALRASQGHGREAEAGFRAALATNPRYLPALVNLAILCTESGRTAEAAALWKRILTVDPGNEQARRMLATLHPQAAATFRRDTAGRQPRGEE